MLVYVLALLGFAAVLFLSYRALGSPAGAGEQERSEALGALHAEVERGSRRLVAALENRAGSLPSRAREVGRQIGGAQQQLSRLEDGGPDGAATLRSLLVMAAEDVGWACRIIESERYWEDPALRGAVAELLAGSRRCLETGAALLAAAGSG